MNKIAQSLEQIDKTAKKYNAKVTLSAGDKEVVLADHREDEPETQEGVVLDSLVTLVKNHISTIVARKAEMKEKKAQLEGSLLSHDTYANASLAVKNAQKMKKEAKENLLEQNQEYRKLDADIKDLRFEVKEKQLSLFDYLLEYHNQTQATEIVDNIGESHTILIEAKIKI